MMHSDDFEIITYNPQGNVPRSVRLTAATQLMKTRVPEAMLDGPAGTGKTLANLHHANLILSKYPRCRVGLVRKTRSSLTESAMVTYEKLVIGPGNSQARPNLELYPDAQSTQRNQRHSYKYPNGAEMVVTGMDTPERIMSTEYDMFVVPEATELTLNDWELLISRLRNWVVPYQQICGDCNPTYPSHWLNKRMQEGKTLRLISRHEDNPALWDGKNWTEKGARYLDGLRRLSGTRFKRLFLGIWAAAEGVVYPDYDAAKHIIEPFEIPKDWRRIRVIDFGFRHPFVCQWWAISPDGVMYMYREIYHTGIEIEDHAKLIVQLSAGEKYEATITDHDAGQRQVLHKYKIRTRLAYKEVRPGIDAVSMRLREGSPEKPRIVRIAYFNDALVARDPFLAETGAPTRTVEEFESYSYEIAKEGRAEKEEPRKMWDDGMDATRYAVVHVDDVASLRFKCHGGRARSARRVA
jgi:PBSX family phage terminase large subunit